jgi:hypothetical protein
MLSPVFALTKTSLPLSSITPQTTVPSCQTRSSTAWTDAPEVHSVTPPVIVFYDGSDAAAQHHDQYQHNPGDQPGSPVETERTPGRSRSVARRRIHGQVRLRWLVRVARCICSHRYLHSTESANTKLFRVTSTKVIYNQANSAAGRWEPNRGARDHFFALQT